MTASDEEPGKITFWCPSFEQGDDQELVLGKLSMHRSDNDTNNRSVGIHKMTSTDDFETEFRRFRDGRVCQRVRLGYTGLTSPSPDFYFTGIVEPSMTRFSDGVIGGETEFFPQQSSTVESDPHGEGGFVGGFQWRPSALRTLCSLDTQSKLFSGHHLTCDASVRYEQGDEPHMKGSKAAAATMNADNTYVVMIHNEHDKMRFFAAFPRLFFEKTNKMNHKLRETLSRAGVCLHQENWDPGDLANRWEQWADRSLVSLDSCLPLSATF